MAGFDKPILHGLCSFGIVCRILKDTSKGLKLVCISCDFLNQIVPGDVISIFVKNYEKILKYYVKVDTRVVLKGVAEFISNSNIPATFNRLKSSSNLTRNLLSKMSSLTKESLANKVR